MAYVYVAALVIGLGILLVQVLGGGHHGDAAHDGHLAGHHGGGKELKGAAGGSGLVAILGSTRFWVFAALAFGLSGSLLHFLGLAGTLTTGLVAAGAGIASGIFAALTFRAAMRASVSASSRSSEAVGRVGKLVVAAGKGRVGRVRVELRGQSVDLLATTEEEELARGERVLVEDVQGDVAHVSRRPEELGD